jgi:hypothetical protein
MVGPCDASSKAHALSEPLIACSRACRNESLWQVLLEYEDRGLIDLDTTPPW